ncbi:MAG TPA: cytidine deaminase [Fimbriimonadaceae bacterium]|jgi:cytidine deaminase
MSHDPLALIHEAEVAGKYAYAPYSEYKVGACVVDNQGNTYTGCNIENASYGSSMCAERVAIFKMVSDGGEVLNAIAVVTEDGGPPCGNCLQVMREFCKDSSQLRIYLSSANRAIKEFTLKDLLPIEFSLDPERK